MNRDASVSTNTSRVGPAVMICIIHRLSMFNYSNDSSAARLESLRSPATGNLQCRDAARPACLRHFQGQALLAEVLECRAKTFCQRPAAQPAS
jgi:hypothetical protein